MGVLERIAKLADHAGGAARGYRALGAQQVVKRAAFEQRHREVVLAIGLAHVEDAYDARMLQRGGETRFTVEQPQERLVGRKLRLEHLNRTGLSQQSVLGAIHQAHAASAELLTQ